MAQRMSKLEAATRLDVSASTIDRMIQCGELQVHKEPHGNRYRVWVLMDDGSSNMSDEPSSDSSADTSDGFHEASVNSPPGQGDMSEILELTVLRERVKNLEEVADYHREQLKDSEWRYQQAMEQLGTSQRTVETLTKALPTAVDGNNISPRRGWWPFGKRS